MIKMVEKNRKSLETITKTIKNEWKKIKEN